MTTPTLHRVESARPASETTAHLRTARVRFCDREDAEMFLEWLQLRSLSRGTPITLALFMTTAADAYAVSSALTGAVLEEVSAADLPADVADLATGPAAPPAIGPFRTPHGWEVMQVVSARR